ncbi:class I SAM-dependent methyltransferase [Chryseolinea sp. H1M3-3]|uniref:class I SAM-dependent methyltransferase n=1 Tax=Chryseolinea sp. H1M3-3 TaxID=3034144 RepID=UPI0023EE2220|nr:class I SAM-dependent methyltransferase [Chryseolinea sp. H1M3-3]
MIKLIIYALKRFAWFKRLNAKVTYELLAKRVPAAEWQFMNYGYVPNPNEKPIEVPEDPSIQKYPLQMYHYLALKTDLGGKKVLEVGSGRGGGAKHVASALKPASYIGMDLAQNAVDLANKLHHVPNLKFIQGSAEEIPLPDNSVDVVLNVESCHAYGSVEKFINEVKRVLKPNGTFALVDFRDADKMYVLRQQLKNSGLTWIEEEDISSNVVRAIEAEDEVKKARIKKLFPPKWQKLFGEFAGVVGSTFHTKMKNGVKVYHRFVLKKPA